MISTRCECKTVMNFGINSTGPIVNTIECDAHSAHNDCDVSIHNGAGSTKTIECIEHARE